ncbi:MAG: hypothetical protein KAR00_00135 [Candidatus Pacebacteria bacterium]|nr:hypothetical protein [Candidatus Paceibacterota bacterium]
MKKPNKISISLFLVITLLLSPALNTYAQNTKDTIQIKLNSNGETQQLKKQMEKQAGEIEQKRETVREEIETRVRALKIDVEQRQEEARERLEEQKEKITDQANETREEARRRIRHGIDVSLNQIVRRLLAAIDRAELLAGRIFSRIEKLKEEGVDTSDPEEHLTTAKAEIEEALVIVEKIPEAITDIVTADTLREAFEEARELVKEAKEKIHSVYSHLREAIKSLKEIVKLKLNAETDSEN